MISELLSLSGFIGGSSLCHGKPMASPWQALFCDTGLLRLAVSRNCGHLHVDRYYEFGYLLACLLLAYLIQYN